VIVCVCGGEGGPDGSVCVLTYRSVHVHMYVYAYAYMYVYIYAYMYKQVRNYVHLSI